MAIVEPTTSLQIKSQLMFHFILGSTNAVVQSIHGTGDIETAAIHIVLGKHIRQSTITVNNAT